MKKFLGIIVLFLFICNPVISAGKYKDIKGFKKQHISMSKKKVNTKPRTTIPKSFFI